MPATLQPRFGRTIGSPANLPSTNFVKSIITS